MPVPTADRAALRRQLLVVMRSGMEKRVAVGRERKGASLASGQLEVKMALGCLRYPVKAEYPEQLAAGSVRCQVNGKSGMNSTDSTTSADTEPCSKLRLARDADPVDTGSEGEDTIDGAGLATFVFARFGDLDTDSESEDEDEDEVDRDQDQETLSDSDFDSDSDSDSESSSGSTGSEDQHEFPVALTTFIEDCRNSASHTELDAVRFREHLDGPGHFNEVDNDDDDDTKYLPTSPWLITTTPFSTTPSNPVPIPEIRISEPDDQDQQVNVAHPDHGAAEPYEPPYHSLYEARRPIPIRAPRISVYPYRELWNYPVQWICPVPEIPITKPALYPQESDEMQEGFGAEAHRRRMEMYWQAYL